MVWLKHYTATKSNENEETAALWQKDVAATLRGTLVTGHRNFGDGTIMTTQFNCSSIKSIILWKLNFTVWHLNRIFSQDKLETNQALTQQHLLISAIKSKTVTFTGDKVWGEGKCNKQFGLQLLWETSLTNKFCIHHNY